MMRINAVPENVYAYTAVISAMHGAALWREALQVLVEMGSRTVQKNSVAVNAALSACAAAGEWQQACQLLYMATFRQLVDGVTYSTFLNALAQSAQWRLALSIFEELPSKSVDVRVHAVTSVISACQRAEQWEHALVIFQCCSLHGIEKNLVAHNAAITAFASGSLWELAIAFTLHDDSFSADIRTFNAAMSALAKTGLWRRGLQLLSGLQRRAMRANIVTYNTLLAACERSGHGESALRILKKMRRVLVQADAVSFNTLISTCAKASCWQEGVALFRNMEQARVNAENMAGTAIIKACASCAQWQQALKVLSIYGARADLYLLSSGISICQRTSAWQTALGLFADLHRTRLTLDAVVCNSVLSSLAAAILSLDRPLALRNVFVCVCLHVPAVCLSPSVRHLAPYCEPSTWFLH